MATSTTWKKNPYIIGRPITEPEMFFGRRELFNFITDSLSQGTKVTLLHGQRRIGKSSVLRHIPNFVPLEEFVFIQFDLQDQARKPLTQVLHSLSKEISNRLEKLLKIKVIPCPLEELEQNLDFFVDAFLPKVYEHLSDKNLVLLLDEFDALSDPVENAAIDHFFPYLQSIIYKQEKLFLIPVVGRRLSDMPTLLGLFREAPHREIGLLDERSIRELITKPVESVLEYTSEAIESIFKLTSGHPYFTQVLCNVVFAYARDEEKTSVTQEDVEMMVDKAIETGEGGLTWFRDGLPIAERVFFSAVAEYQEKIASTHEEKVNTTRSGTKNPWELLEQNGIVITEELRNAAQNLVEWGFIREEQANTFAVIIELVRLWLVKRSPLRNEIWELEKLSPEAQKMYKHVKKIGQQNSNQAIKLYEKILKLNPNHLHALLDFVEKFVEPQNSSSVDLKTIKQFQRAYIIDPLRTHDGFVTILLTFGRSLMLEGKGDEAREIFAGVLQLSPDDIQAKQARLGLSRLNPFVVGTPVRPNQFIGRQKEVEEILSTISYCGHIAIYGEQGLGKTSLLHYITSPDILRINRIHPLDIIILYLDFSTFSVVNFWSQVESKLTSKANSDPMINIFTHERQLRGGSGVQKILRASNDKSRKQLIVLAIDNFDGVLKQQTKSVTSFLTELLEYTTPNTGRVLLSLIISTELKLNELWKRLGLGFQPFFNLFHQSIPLNPFDRTEAATLMAKMPEVFALSEEERTWVNYIAGNHPFLLQAALYTLFQSQVENNPFEVNTITKELMDILNSYFSKIFNGLTDNEKQLLLHISLRNTEWRAGIQLITGKVQLSNISRENRPSLVDLEGRGLIRLTQVGTTALYLLFTPLMEWWILKNPPKLNNDSGYHVQVERLRKLDLLPENWARSPQNISKKEVEPILSSG